MIEYICKACDQSEITFEIIPCKKCPSCNKFMEAIEEE